MRIEILAVACAALAIPVAAWSQEAAPSQTGSRVRVTRMATLLAADQPLGAQPGATTLSPQYLIRSTGALLECDAARLRMISDGSPAEAAGDTLALARSQIVKLETGHRAGNGGIGALAGMMSGAVVGLAVADKNWIALMGPSNEEQSSVTILVSAGIGLLVGGVVGHFALKTEQWQEVPPSGDR